MNTYKINNTLLFLQPEKGKWVNRNQLGMDGGGHPVYATPREFELHWGYMDASGLAQLQGFYNLMGNSGTVSVDLPQYSAPYTFYTYSGCTMSEPQVGDFYEEFYTDVMVHFYKVNG